MQKLLSQIMYIPIINKKGGTTKMKKVLIPLVALIMVLGLALSITTPALASNPGNQIDVVPASPNIYHLGDTITYEVTISNLHATETMNVTAVYTTLPDGTTWDPGLVPFSLAAGDSVTYNPTWVVTVSGVSATGIITAESTFAGIQLSTFPDPFTSVATKTSLVIQPELSIEKTVDCNDDGVFLDVDTGIAGDTGHWKVVVTNTGDSTVLNIVVTDTNGNDFGVPFDLDPGDSREFNYDTVVNVDTLNTATAVGDDGIGGIVGPVSDDATNLVIHPELSIEKTVDCNDDGVFLDVDTGIAGDTGHWKVVVTNTGDSTVLNIVVTDTNGNDFGVPFDLDPGDSREFNYDTVVNVDTLNTATAVGDDGIGGIVGPVSDDAANLIVGEQGCTPGFWKVQPNFDPPHVWCDTYDPDDLVESVFSIPGALKVTLTDGTIGVDLQKKADGVADTLDEALAYGGGKGVEGAARNLLRSAVAAVLNACNDNVAYPIGEQAVIDAVNAALASLDRDVILSLHTTLDGYNNLGCSIDNRGNPIPVAVD